MAAQEQPIAVDSNEHGEATGLQGSTAGTASETYRTIELKGEQMAMPDATVEDVLMAIASMADNEMTRLATAIEGRNIPAMGHLIATAYNPVILLKGLARDFELPDDWRQRAEDIFSEYHRLRMLANRVSGFPRSS